MADKKDVFIRVRSDEELKKALQERASHEDRSEADEARHLLRIALGLKEPVADPVYVAESRTTYRLVKGKKTRAKVTG